MDKTRRNIWMSPEKPRWHNLIITKKSLYRESKNRSKSTAIDGSRHAAGPEAVVYIDHRQPG